MDEGVGLRPEEIELLFKPFAMFKKQGCQNSVSSHGFGLSICKQICTQLGGSIQAESYQQVGSTFTFTMKIEVPRIQDANLKEITAKKQEEPQRILSQIVEVREDTKSDGSPEDSLSIVND